MASIVKRKSKYSVVYDYTDENGKRRQRWETFSTNAEAKKRKKQIEYEQDSGTFFIPTAKTLNDLLDEYMSIYGVNTWAMSTYESRRGLARNYITPIIGDMLLSDITPRMMDKYYRDLLSVKTVSVNNRKPTSEYLTPHTVREIHKLLRSAFNQAVRWELISRNPVLNATLPKEEHKERDIWTAETLSKAMEVCDDPILSLALNLAFSCSLRIGEMLGLTWDCIDIAPQSIENGSAYIFVNKELQRVTRGALDDLSDKGVINSSYQYCLGVLTQGSTPDGYIAVISQRHENAEQNVREVFDHFAGKLMIQDSEYPPDQTAHYSPGNYIGHSRGVYYNAASDMTNPRGAGTTYFHELAHMIDHASCNYRSNLSNTPEFAEALVEDGQRILSLYNNLPVEKQTAFLTRIRQDSAHSFSDLIDATTNGQLHGNYGHSRNYWTRPGNLQAEAFAHFFEASMGDQGKLELLANFFPTAFGIFSSMIDSIRPDNHVRVLSRER